MKRSLFLLGGVVALLALGTTNASAGDVTLPAGDCFFDGGGQITEPAGSTITVSFIDGEVNRGMLQNFLQTQTTTLAINGGTAIDVSSLHGAPMQNPNGTWVATWTYPTGITLENPGDTMTFTITIELSRLFAEVTNGPVGFNLGYLPGPPIFTPAGVYFTGDCTVTAV